MTSIVFQLHDMENNPLGCISLTPIDRMYKIREYARDTLFAEWIDIEQSAWKCTLYRKCGDIFRVISDDDMVQMNRSEEVIYVKLREVKGVKLNTKVYELERYWDNDCQFEEEAYDYLIHEFDKMVHNNHIYEFKMLTDYGFVIDDIDLTQIEPVLIDWILQEKEKLYNSTQWCVWHDITNQIPSVYNIVYRKLFRYCDYDYQLTISHSCCYCRQNELCDYCSNLDHEKYNFALRQYGKVNNHDEDLFISDMLWNYRYK